MYFVVYFIKPKIRVVVPKKWIFAIEEHWEKFINNSINRNQTFVVFYSNEGDAMNANQMPNTDFTPDFSFADDRRDFPQTGCYLAKLICYKGMNF